MTTTDTPPEVDHRTARQITADGARDVMIDFRTRYPSGSTGAYALAYLQSACERDPSWYDRADLAFISAGLTQGSTAPITR